MSAARIYTHCSSCCRTRPGLSSAASVVLGGKVLHSTAGEAAAPLRLGCDGRAVGRGDARRPSEREDQKPGADGAGPGAIGRSPSPGGCRPRARSAEVDAAEGVLAPAEDDDLGIPDIPARDSSQFSTLAVRRPLRAADDRRVRSRWPWAHSTEKAGPAPAGCPRISRTVIEGRTSP
jgi:hypothetical protein